jgi:hypothetical protein
MRPHPLRNGGPNPPSPQCLTQGPAVIPLVGGQVRGPLPGRSVPPRNARPVHHRERRLQFMDVGPGRGHRQRQPTPLGQHVGGAALSRRAVPYRAAPLLGGDETPIQEGLRPVQLRVSGQGAQPCLPDALPHPLLSPCLQASVAGGLAAVLPTPGAAPLTAPPRARHTGCLGSLRRPGDRLREDALGAAVGADGERSAPTGRRSLLPACHNPFLPP